MESLKFLLQHSAHPSWLGLLCFVGTVISGAIWELTKATQTGSSFANVSCCGFLFRASQGCSFPPVCKGKEQHACKMQSCDGQILHLLSSLVQISSNGICRLHEEPQRSSLRCNDRLETTLAGLSFFSWPAAHPQEEDTPSSSCSKREGHSKKLILHFKW